jgi:hypothetical protein
MKKEVSEHLARAFFETESVSEEPKTKEHHFVLFVVVSLGVVLGLIFGVNVLWRMGQRNMLAASQSLGVERHGGPYRLKFDFQNNPSKIEALYIDLPDLDLKDYSRVRFSSRLRGDIRDLGSLKIVLETARRESHAVYTPGVASFWRRLEIPLEEFKSIHDRSRVSRISFILEPWNVKARKGELLIDNVEFSRN